MKIIAATSNDFRRILSFYYELIDSLQNAEYGPGWMKDIYPAPDDLRLAIESGCLYYAERDGRIAACMVVNHGFNPEYENAKWRVDASAEEILVIHMLGVNPAFARQGIAKQMVQFVIDRAASDGMKAVRLDVMKGNLPAEKLYPALGFQYIETLPMYYEDTGWMDFELYELLLEK